MGFLGGVILGIITGCSLGIFVTYKIIVFALYNMEKNGEIEFFKRGR